MQARDPRNRPYRIATYIVFMIFVVLLCVLTTVSIVKSLHF